MKPGKTTLMTYKEFADGLELYEDNARLIVLHKVKFGGKWKNDAERFISRVELAFDDTDRNFRRWLALQKCVFDHPVTHIHTEILIGDDCEAIFHFLVYCRKIHKAEPIDEDFADYLAYLIGRSNYTEDT